jgi:hypothetical protein
LNVVKPKSENEERTVIRLGTNPEGVGKDKWTLDGSNAFERLAEAKYSDSGQAAVHLCQSGGRKNRRNLKGKPDDENRQGGSVR